MTNSGMVMADGLHFPPGTEEFIFRDWFPALSDTFLANTITTITFIVWASVGLIMGLFLWAYRKPQLVPTRRQWLAESTYGFIRNNVAIDLMGKKYGVRFAPYLATLFLFIAFTNLFGIIPGIQISSNSHIAFPLVLGIASWLLYNWVGIRKFGVLKYLKNTCVPPGVPWPILVLLIPIEFFTNLILRPFTLALRLFAAMFAGHLILLVFILGGFTMLQADNFLIQGMSIFSFLMAIAFTFFELFIMLLQAYIFTLLTALYMQGALSEEH